MNRKVLVSSAVVLAVLLALAGCKTSGMAATSRGQLYKINIYAPKDLPEGADDNIDIVLSNRGVNELSNILTDVEMPPQLIVLDQTQDRFVTVTHDPGSNVYHFSISGLSPAQDAHLRFHVRTAFGTATETGQISVTSWANDLPGDKLFRKTTIGLRR